MNVMKVANQKCRLARGKARQRCIAKALRAIARGGSFSGAHARKTKDEYRVEVNYGYGHGWEHEISEPTRTEAVARRNEYRANTSYPVRIVKKRVRI